jgi:hypothetical protein
VNCPTGTDVDPWPAGNRWSPAGLGLPTHGQRPLVTRQPTTSGRGQVTAGRPGLDCWSLAVQWPRASRRPAGARRPQVDASTPGPVGQFPFFLNFFFLLPSTFCASGQLFASWLHHMPTLPKLLLETSNTHNFWFVGPKNTIFFSREAYCEAHVHKKFQKI